MSKSSPTRATDGLPGADKVLAPLGRLARNLWWTWTPEAAALLRDADPKTFAACGNNPLTTIARLTPARLARLAADVSLVGRLRAAERGLRDYLRDRTWYSARYGPKSDAFIAYFCMEYGLHASLPLYAGGLGVLAGDHLKSASDLGVPLVGVGIYWRHGYVTQRIDRQGRQTDHFLPLPVEAAPLVEVASASGRPLRVPLAIGDERVQVRVWRLDVGRVPLFLLDTDLPANAPRIRQLVSVLYSGDRDMRIRQEILLGIGGWRALRAMGIPVGVCHLNEGHAALLSLERIAERMESRGESFRQALRHVRDTSVFTTHTPVPAGNEEFDPLLVDRYLSGYARRLGLGREAFHDLARVRPGSRSEAFGMTPLALHTCRWCNGVAALHGRVAREMWQAAYPVRRAENVPIGHVTNGVHLRTWLHPLMGELLDETLGLGWEERQDLRSAWNRVRRIPDQRLWEVHALLKVELIEACRRRIRERFRRLRLPVAEADRILDPDALTIAFARRFAGYKRAALIFTDPRRLAGILSGSGRPVQIIFAGKAHPADAEGKALVQQIARFSAMPRFRRHVVLLENYDMEIARLLVAGADVWLNNPRRPREASGTSGMKSALHGGLNLSILDGWWPEAFNGRNGWAIGRPVDHDGSARADRRDAADLYRVLEKHVVPAFYRRDRQDLPRAWIAMMKDALAGIPPFFNAHRQVKQYLTRYYMPAMARATAAR